DSCANPNTASVASPQTAAAAGSARIARPRRQRLRRDARPRSWDARRASTSSCRLRRARSVTRPRLGVVDDVLEASRRILAVAALGVDEAAARIDPEDELGIAMGEVAERLPRARGDKNEKR